MNIEKPVFCHFNDVKVEESRLADKIFEKSDAKKPELLFLTDREIGRLTRRQYSFYFRNKKYAL